MKAAAYRRFGSPDVVRIEDIARPVAGPGEVLIEVRASSVTAADWRFRARSAPPGLGPLAALMMGVRRPRFPVLGCECAGRVAELGAGVTEFAVGDRVVAFPSAQFGCHAEFKAMPVAGAIARLPDAVDFEQAAVLSFAGTSALDFLTVRGRLRQGEAVLVIGAAGAVGHTAVQLGRHFGAHVTGVARAEHLDLVATLGAEETLDYRATDIASLGPRFDIVFDTSGSVGWGTCRRLLKPGGRAVLLVAGLGGMLTSLPVNLLTGKRILVGDAREKAEDLVVLADLVAQGALRPVIGARFPLDRIAEAHASKQTGHAAGNTLVTVGGS